jgi:hypothetical protein
VHPPPGPGVLHAFYAWWFIFHKQSPFKLLNYAEDSVQAADSNLRFGALRSIRALWQTLNTPQIPMPSIGPAPGCWVTCGSLDGLGLCSMRSISSMRGHGVFIFRNRGPSLNVHHGQCFTCVFVPGGAFSTCCKNAVTVTATVFPKTLN